jgi:hypothetical protein
MGMIRDAYRTFMDGAIGTSQGTTYTDAFNVGEQGFPIDKMHIYGQIIDAATSGGSATVQFVIEKDTTSAFGSATEVWDSGAIAVATLVDDYVIKNAVIDSLDWQEAVGSDTWLRIKIVIATADLTAGDAFFGIVSGTPPINTRV